ncbi:MAG: AgmX/PglI C-terminal domain-containing protein [Alphaproteobacteria bacterium]|nr:AgmX/PglI C-terminal domain-containing protein [Alphaproteobacteria bacterium]
MSAQKSTSRVLFIGVVQDGKVVQERAMPAGETVTVGGASKATFAFPDTPFGNDAFPLFQVQDGAYHFRYTEAVKGKITASGERISLDKAAKEGKVPQQGGVYTVKLDESDKGKVRLGSVTILFKFVEPAAVGPAPPPVDLKLDFRPRLIEDDEDPIFLGFLAIWIALGIALSILVNSVEPREYDLEEIPDRFTKVVLDLPPPEIEEPEPEPEVDDAMAVETTAAATKPKPSDKPAEQKSKAEQVADAKANEARKDKLAGESALFQAMQAKMIGTTGENAKGSVLISNTDGDYSDIAERLAAAEAAGGPIGDGSRLRGADGVAGGTGTRDIGGVEAGEGGGGVAVGPGPALKTPKGTVSAGALEVDGASVAGVSAVVRKYQGQLKYCYEKSLKSNPKLAGRVVVGWYVEDGAASDVYIADNTTGDDELASCIKSKVARWDFKDVEDGEAKSPFIFAPQE